MGKYKKLIETKMWKITYFQNQQLDLALLLNQILDYFATYISFTNYKSDLDSQLQVGCAASLLLHKNYYNYGRSY